MISIKRCGALAGYLNTQYFNCSSTSSYYQPNHTVMVSIVVLAVKGDLRFLDFTEQDGRHALWCFSIYRLVSLQSQLMFYCSQTRSTTCQVTLITQPRTESDGAVHEHRHVHENVHFTDRQTGGGKSQGVGLTTVLKKNTFMIRKKILWIMNKTE